MAYKKPVIESIYSNLTHYAVVVDNVLYPYIQNKDVYLFCLICEESLPNIDLHVKSKKHTKKLKDQKLLNAVKFFHEQFLPLTLPHQMEQIYFIPKKLTCLLCQAHCYTSANIVNHIDEEGHKNQVETREKIYKTYSLCDINSGYSSLAFLYLNVKKKIFSNHLILI